MTSPHTMIDLETLGTGPNAMILSIGAAKFDPSADGILDSFHVGIDLSQVPLSRNGLYGEIDPSTVAFWLKAEQGEGRKALAEVPKTDMGSALDGFALWLGTDTVEKLRVWGNGAAFDNVILRSAYERLGLEVPWRYWNDRCFRTFKKLAPALDMERHGDLHNALDDAITQALHVQKIVKALELTVD